MSNMQKDGISGFVSDYVDSDRLVDVRPDDNPYVRVTHFPYEGDRIDHKSLSDDGSSDSGTPTIPLGKSYEVSVWAEGTTLDCVYGPMNGAEEACEQAIAIAIEEGNLPIWDTIIRHRPRVEIIEQTPMKTISGDYRTVVMETDDGWVALDRETGVGSGGASREDALDDLDDRVDWYTKNADQRTGEIVETDDVLGDEPRIDGTRISVEHIVNTYERTESIPHTAASFVGVVTLDEVKAALEWADDT